MLFNHPVVYAHLHRDGHPLAWHVHLAVSKHIPEQAGLGGGSSNAACVVQLLQQHFNAPLKTHELATLALQLGADRPLFLQPHCAWVEGIGEQLTPLPDIEGHLLVYKPPESCKTNEIFSARELTRGATPVKIAVFDSGPHQKQVFSEWLWRFLRENTNNALEPAVKALSPTWCKRWSHFSELAGAHLPLLLRMTGSGSAVFAAYATSAQADAAFQACQALEGQLFRCQIEQSTAEQHTESNWQYK
ncbi:MAG: hypothetical protein HC848_07955 [Limnobacter sp.]|nr:hypothetical protein [Limnobacter sp.]